MKKLSTEQKYDEILIIQKELENGKESLRVFIKSRAKEYGSLDNYLMAISLSPEEVEEYYSSRNKRELPF